MAVELVRQYFLERSIDLIDDWLHLSMNFLLQQKKFASNEELISAVFEQWLFTNLKLSTQPSLKAKLENGTFRLFTSCYLQITSLVDIGASLFSQYTKLTSEFEDISGFECSLNDEGDSPKRNDFQSQPRRMLFFKVSDGSSELKAIEYRPIKQLSVLTLPGCKIFVDSKTVCRKNILFLTEQNCSVLGGDDDSLVKIGRPLEVICCQLKKSAGRAKSDYLSRGNPNVASNKSERSVGRDALLSVNSLHFPFNRGVPQKSSTVLNEVESHHGCNQHLREEVSRISDRNRCVASNPASCSSFSSSKTNFFREETLSGNDTPSSSGYVTQADQNWNISERRRSKGDSEIIRSDDRRSFAQLEVSRNVTGQPENEAMTSESENSVAIKYIDTGIMYIAEIQKSMRFVLGAKRKLIALIKAVMVDVDEPLTIEDDIWFMSVILADESCPRLKCVVAHSVLEELIGLTPKEAETVRCSTSKARRKEGTLRLKSVQESMERLDLIWEIEFHSNINFVPVVKGIATYAQKLQIFD